MSADSFKITPLGGVGQIGSNMNLIEFEEQSILLDAGILFPRNDSFGINYLIPDFESLKNIDHIIITHGHEDHIGAIHHVVKKFPKIKIWCSKFAKSLIQNKLNYKKLSANYQLFKEGDKLSFENLTVMPIHVNHSIPETFGILFKFNQDSLFYCSDFKIDLTGLYEKPFNLSLLKSEIENSQKKILMLDSTNILSSKLETPSEKDIISNLDEIFKNAPSRIIATCFSSNIHRIQSLVSLAKKYDRRVCFYGRSMQYYSDVAIDHNYLRIDKSINIEQACEKDNALILVSGCQGDFKSTLRRICSLNDTYVKPNSTDTFILSSKTIPGNSPQITEILNLLSQLKSKIFTGDYDPIHVSGHPGRGDLLSLCQETNPTHIIPIHGESYFLQKHIEHLNENLPDVKSLLMQNHDTLIVNDKVEVKDLYNFLEPILIHGNDNVIARENISQRRKIAQNGLVVISAKLKNKIEVKSSFEGLPIELIDTKGLEDLLKQELNSIKNKNIVPSEVENHLRISTRRFINKDIGYKPQTIVHLL